MINVLIKLKYKNFILFYCKARFALHASLSSVDDVYNKSSKEEECSPK